MTEIGESISHRKIPDEAARDFDIRIRLIDREITPFKVPSFDGAETQDYVRFELEIEENTVERVSYEIAIQSDGDRRRILHRENPSSFREQGVHVFEWDGFGDDDVFDTKILSDSELEIKATAILDGVEKVATVKLLPRHHRCRWVDVKYSKGSTDVEVQLRAAFRDGGTQGLNVPGNRSPNSSSPSQASGNGQNGGRTRDFEALKKLASDGLVRYWSRNSTNKCSVTTPRGTVAVTIKPFLTDANAMPPVSLVYRTNRKWGRSRNPGKGLVGAVIKAKIFYNTGRIRNEDEWSNYSDAEADQEFFETAAHEVGHTILQAYANSEESWTHHGTSKATGKLLDTSPSYPFSPVEIDLMLYYQGAAPSDFYARVRASDADVASLLWLAGVRFHGYTAGRTPKSTVTIGPVTITGS